jgi:Ca-activated chloride channel family protein
MEIDLNQLHFLRPLWLLLILPAILLPLAWQRQYRNNDRLRAVFAPHLLKHLLVKPADQQRFRPAWLLGALLGLGALTAAGPTWELDRPPFMEDQAPLIVAVDLSPSMDAGDVAPDRLSAVKNKLRDLLERRSGARTALIVYAGSAHLVLPPTDDPELLGTYIQALSTSLLDRPGKNALAASEEALRLLAAEKNPGTLVLISDGADTSQLDTLRRTLQASDEDLQVLVLAVGSQSGGLITDASGAPRLDNSGKPIISAFDKDALQQLASALDAPIGSLTQNADDLDWIQLHTQQHFRAANPDNAELHWKDMGYWLCWLLVPLAWLAIRKGWGLSWMPAVLLTLGIALPAGEARAGALADAFFTADQQGRWYFEQDKMPLAAKHFSDPYWKGLAAYQAAEFNDALASFARMANGPQEQRPTAYFYIGNSQARLMRYPEAIIAYTEALRLQPDFPQARANLELVTELQRQFEIDQQLAPEDDEGTQQYDDKGKPGKGKDAMVNASKPTSTELWLRNLSTSPAEFLRKKFRQQQPAAETAEPAQ